MKKGIKALVITGSVIAGIVFIYAILLAIYVSNFRREYRISENSIDAIVNELQHVKIIAIGESHDQIIEEMFIANNIQALYDAGVRYIFQEGGHVPTPSDDTYYFVMYYPWANTGWRYENVALNQAVNDFNNTLQSDDIIRVINPERLPNNKDELDFRQYWNLRDSTAAETIIGIMDASADSTKAIVIYGGDHTILYSVNYYIPESYPERFEWFPLGHLLKEHYGNNFSSYSFEYGKDIVINTKHLADVPKLVALKNIQAAKIPFMNAAFGLLTSWKYIGFYDGYIIEPEATTGSMYQYNPTNENLSLIFKLVEDYALEYGDTTQGFNYSPYEAESRIIQGVDYLKSYFEHIMNYASPSTTYNIVEPQGQFMLGLYCLKLYFGDKFDFTFWKTEPSKSLLYALAELKDYAFSENTPSNYLQINYSPDTMRLFHQYLYSSGIARFNDFSIPGSSIGEDYLLQARRIIPEDLWPLYWLGFLAVEKRQWEKGLEFFQELFGYELAFFMESLPLAYQKAALCAAELGQSLLAEEYYRISAALYNEYNITVDENNDSEIGYPRGLQAVKSY